MSISKYTSEKFIYLWEVKDPQYCTLPVGQFIDCPKFCVPQLCNTEWFLRLFPSGNNEIFKDSTSCFLNRGYDNGPLKFNIIMNSENETFTESRSFIKNTSAGFAFVLPHALDTYETSNLIMCEIHCESNHLKTAEELHLINIKTLKFPIKCFAQTKFLHETKFIQHFVDPLINGSVSKMTIPLIFGEEYPSLIMELRNNLWDMIYLNIGLRDNVFKELFIVVCNIHVKNSTGQVLYSFEGKHKFSDGGNEIWCLTKHINKSHLTAHLHDFSLNNINLTGEFSISVGQTISDITRVERIKVLRNDVPSNEYIPSNEIFRVIKDKKLCDFALKIGDDKIDVHKVVLVAASPVFAAMISNEMTEKKNNVVDIVDVDKATVDEMVSFMYTGSVKELDYESAKKLFVAGDKYQISPLLDALRNVIISFISTDTICDILAIADTHNDKELVNEAVKFVKVNKGGILTSLKWATFESENGNLAARILKQVCLLNKRKRL